MLTYRSLNSTATSTMTSTGVPKRRAGMKRHCLTASIATLIEAGAETAQQPHVADGAVTAHDNLELDIAGDASTTGILGVVGFDFAKN